jgi:AraC family transcriptional regulator
MNAQIKEPNLKRLPPGHLYGQNLRARIVAGLTLTETAYAPDCYVPKHSHELSQLCFVREGRFSEVYGRRSREGVPLTLIVRPSNETHSHRFHQAGARCFVIEIGSESLCRIREHSAVLDDSAEFQNGRLTWLAMRLYNEFHQEDGAAALAIEGLTLEILSEVSRKPMNVLDRHPPSWLEHARDFLHSHFSEPITLTDVAISAGAHPTHLARVFRRFYRCTMGEYVRGLRIEFACQQASATDASFTEIAIAAGFYDQSHFSRTFKQIIGVTPRQYRAAFRSR